jgi:hypothetical protein
MAEKAATKTEVPDTPRICFVISPIGADQSDTRKRSNQILKHIIQPAAKACGFEVRRADSLAATGIITTQVVQHIIDSELVIADLTDSNANVFYELAIRHMLRKPYIQMIHKSQPPPFDVAAVRTLLFNHLDLDEAEAAREELIKQIKAVENQKDVESPISVAVDLDKLTKSDKPEQRQMADLLKGFSSLQSRVEMLSRLITDRQRASETILRTPLKLDVDLLESLTLKDRQTIVDSVWDSFRTEGKPKLNEKPEEPK